MADITFIFDKFVNNKPVIEGLWPMFGPSPFVEHVAVREEYRDCFDFKTLSEVLEDTTVDTSGLFVIPLGVGILFHIGLESRLCIDNTNTSRIMTICNVIRKRDDIYILLDMSWECGTASNLDAVPRLARLLEIPVRRLIFMANNANLARFSDAPGRYGFAAIGAWFFEFYTPSMQTLALSSSSVSQSPEIVRNKRTFLTLNRRMRFHRLLLVAYLQNRGYDRVSFLSFGGKSANLEDNKHLVPLAIEQCRWAAELLRETIGDLSADINAIAEGPSRDLDLNFSETKQGDDKFNTSAIRISSEVTTFYDNAHVSIVTETDFGDSVKDFLLTEKIFKPILHRHPFILFSGPYALAALSDLGYETYGQIIPDAYDRVVDPYDRFAELCRTIEHVYQAIARDPLAFAEDCAAIAARNQARLVSDLPARVRDFVKRFKSEVLGAARFGKRPASSSNLAPGEERIFSFDKFSGLEFTGAFYQHEVANRGRWCSDSGVLTLWLPEGPWRLTFFVHGTNPECAPKIYLNRELCRIEVATKGDRLALTVSFDAREPANSGSTRTEPLFPRTGQGVPPTGGNSDFGSTTTSCLRGTASKAAQAAGAPFLLPVVDATSEATIWRHLNTRPPFVRSARGRSPPTPTGASRG